MLATFLHDYDTHRLATVPPAPVRAHPDHPRLLALGLGLVAYRCLPVCTVHAAAVRRAVPVLARMTPRTSGSRYIPFSRLVRVRNIHANYVYNLFEVSTTRRSGTSINNYPSVSRAVSRTSAAQRFATRSHRCTVTGSLRGGLGGTLFSLSATVDALTTSHRLTSNPRQHPAALQWERREPVQGNDPRAPW